MKRGGGGEKQSAFTLKAVFVGVILSMVVCMYSAYAGLKAGGVYWPIITATIMSFALLKILGGGKTNKNEVNVAATAASTGGLLAAGIIFTVPAIWLLGLQISVVDVTFIAITGGLLGVLFTIPLREEMIERLKLPYPDGTATGKVLEAGDEGAVNIWRSMGVYLGYGIAHYADFYALKHVLILGRCTSGSGGQIILDGANAVLRAEFPDLAARVNIQLPDEKSRRVGQSIAAASLPEIC